ncbi:hypothetical protein [Candidatus Protochlamydia phocaeensis]|uniref:hypothetical protein n=1 Tax=Candidatus Protochlamydia phocaeensis TaxID=1414722 RepID=UPI0008388306|nr:hypothetical protein [Candidatus Protochlamydia phocaeensis]
MLLWEDRAWNQLAFQNCFPLCVARGVRLYLYLQLLPMRMACLAWQALFFFSKKQTLNKIKPSINQWTGCEAIFS